MKLVIAFVYVFLDKVVLWNIFAYLLNLLRDMLRFIYSKACSMSDTLDIFLKEQQANEKDFTYSNVTSECIQDLK